MTAREGDGGERLAPVTYLPGVAPVDEEPVRWAVPFERAPTMATERDRRRR